MITKKFAKFKHIKTGNIYTVLDEVINCTNAQSEQIMVLYENSEGMRFVREKEEFNEKFRELTAEEMAESFAELSEMLAPHWNDKNDDYTNSLRK